MAHLEGRVEGFDGRFDAIDAKVDRFHDQICGRMERHFRWTMGLKIGLWTAVVAATPEIGNEGRGCAARELPLRKKLLFALLPTTLLLGGAELAPRWTGAADH